MKITKDPYTGIEYIAIPAGEFDMRLDDEKPIHRVRLSAPFLMSRYPVTNQTYSCFLRESERTSIPILHAENFNHPQQPVVGVSWDDAQAFCKWASCRLPTEAEWEYACRAGTTTRFYFGDSLDSTQANFDGNYPFGKGKKGPFLKKLSPVGSYPPNAFGLYDMHGNVWEWCQDWLAPCVQTLVQALVTDPKGPEHGHYRMVRGGSWFDSASECRSAYRDGLGPDARSRRHGFRVCLVRGPDNADLHSSLEAPASPVPAPLTAGELAAQLWYADRQWTHSDPPKATFETNSKQVQVYWTYIAMAALRSPVEVPTNEGTTPTTPTTL
jgi:formylglycine-generating enzyme required for sulfatase activity